MGASFLGVRGLWVVGGLPGVLRGFLRGDGVFLAGGGVVSWRTDGVFLDDLWSSKKHRRFLRCGYSYRNLLTSKLDADFCSCIPPS